MQFRPTLWPTLITIPALAILLALGWWQLQRLQWKTELIEELQIRGAAPAIPLPTDPRIPAADLEFRKVTVSGRYIHEAEMRLLNRVRDGMPGINLVTPLVRDDPPGGTVLVNRGWVPLDWPGTPTGGDSAEPTKVEVTGIVRTAAPPGWLTPDNEPTANNWYYIDLEAMANAAGVLARSDYYIMATDERTVSDSPNAWLVPDPHQWSVDLPNNHLSYAITWFSLAAILLVIYLIYHTSRREPDES